ncbi:hypothetical protein JCM8097_007225, partial [Rhodosporidiobolus ruineniae]
MPSLSDWWPHFIRLEADLQHGDKTAQAKRNKHHCNAWCKYEVAAQIEDLRKQKRAANPQQFQHPLLSKQLEKDLRAEVLSTMTPLAGRKEQCEKHVRECRFKQLAEAEKAATVSTTKKLRQMRLEL